MWTSFLFWTRVGYQIACVAEGECGTYLGAARLQLQKSKMKHPETVALEKSHPSVSRQRIWQLKKRAQGRCINCGGMRFTELYCKYHSKLKSSQTMKRMGHRIRTNNSIYGKPGERF